MQNDMVPSPVHVGCAGWSLPKECAGAFPASGTHLQRYASLLRAVEINSSFYRSHRTSTYARWAASVPEDFRFAVKVPREITHKRRLVDVADILDGFLSEVGALEGKLGPLLVQMPPSLAFSAAAGSFFATLRKRFAGGVVCEPRHRSWFAPDVASLLASFQIARAAADPPVSPAAAEPGGWEGLLYYRLHGAPRVYYSTYSDEHLGTLAERLGRRAAQAPLWCIFDNTALGAATGNALVLTRRLSSKAWRQAA